ncbi:XRE family transcriptional regulator [Amycolatopsis albispora]|uniref:Transcriptional regulator n=1 Tax=Amycolatopsis albispora TaxID=1804986 RepID=A0A344L6F2_9PSEU|nr:XRE family transcriptional regulator [Amycolatopsis albispora]AXB43626.1 transcriptional regulator [Amycolatopsis albispora]
MSRSWREVKAEKEERDRAAGRDVEEARASARETTDAYLVGFRLAQLRQQAGVSQAELARRIGISQPRVSQLENGDLAQMELDTIRRYIAALGGRLRVVAGFGDRDVVVSA